MPIYRKNLQPDMIKHLKVVPNNENEMEEKGMRKKFITFLLAFTLTSSMLLTACGSTETDSGGGKTETETETPADDQQAESEESDEVTTEEDAVTEEDNTTEKENPAEVKEEDLLEVYDAIKESVITEYLEPNGIDPSTFTWPEPGTNWNYIKEMYMQYSLSGDYSPEALSYVSEIYPSPEKEIFRAAFDGFVKWFESQNYDSSYFSKIYIELDPYDETFPENISFSE